MWSNGLAHWTDGALAYVSVAFSWRLPDAYSLALWYREQGFAVRAGGPGLFTRPDYLSDVAQIGGEVDALTYHNPQATMASRGCPVGCYFCVVPRMEGTHFTLLPDFTPRPLLMDNNLSALPVDYQEYVIARYRAAGVVLRDCNSVFEPQTFDEACYRRWAAINRGPWRFAYDTESEGEDVQRVCAMLRDVPQYRKRVYVLIGNEPFVSCYERVRRVIEWGCDPHVQPVIALNALQKRPLVRYDWTKQRLLDMARWANRHLWRLMPFEEYRAGRRRRGDLALAEEVSEARA